MNEEQLTKSILKWLIGNDWKIIAFDFPQSGTGLMIHPDMLTSNKNKKGIIPDIITIKNSVCLFFENKDRFYYSDFLKQNELIIGGEYKKSIETILAGYDVKDIFYGIGLPKNVNEGVLKENKHLVDFIVMVDPLTNQVKLFHDKHAIDRFFD